MLVLIVPYISKTGSTLKCRNVSAFDFCTFCSPIYVHFRTYLFLTLIQVENGQNSNRCLRERLQPLDVSVSPSFCQGNPVNPLKLQILIIFTSDENGKKYRVQTVSKIQNWVFATNWYLKTKYFCQSELGTLEWKTFNPNYLIRISTVETFNFSP